MSFLALLFDKGNPIADFYEGYIEKTMGLHMHHDLDCMERDDNVTMMWDHAIHHLYRDKQKWNEDREKALGASFPLLEGCADNGKWQIASAQIESWWTGFYQNEDWENQMIENFKRHPLLVMGNMALIKLQWNLGYYRAAGKSLGRFDKFLMGHPQWDALPAMEALPVQKINAGKGKLLSEFQAVSFDFGHGTKISKDLMKCLAPDDVEYTVMDAAIKALNPYDDMAWRKYFETTMTMDPYNWTPCMDNKDIMDAAMKAMKTWQDFWGQDNVDQIVEKNVKKHYKELTKTVPALQKEWDAGRMDKAGFYYALYWSYIFDEDLPKPEKK